MKNKKFIIAVIAVMAVSTAVTVGMLRAQTTRTAADPAEVYVEGLRAYKQGDFEVAAQKLQTTAEGGIHNGKLFYNLGNAYLRSGDLGRAVLYYEKAEKFMPGDPELEFNLKYALSEVKDASEVETSPLAKVLFFPAEVFSEHSLQWAALLGHVLVWLGLLPLLFRKRILRAVAPYVWIPGLIIVTAAAPSVLYARYEAAFSPKAVILENRVPIRSGRDANSAELFALHAGSKVVVEARQDDWYRVRFGPEKRGWVPGDVLGLI